MLTFLTVSGSAYEVDVSECRIRRLVNYADRRPTARQTADGEWQPYAVLELVPLGDDMCVFVDWDGAGRGTLTSALLDRHDASRIQAAIDAAGLPGR